MEHRAYNRKSPLFLLPILIFIAAIPVTIGIAGAASTGSSGSGSPSAKVQSPDLPLFGNGKIAFVSNRTGHNQIFTMSSNGSNQTNLSGNNSVEDTFPTWSPSGEFIAFLREASDGSHDIYMMTSNGFGLTRITYGSIANGAPSWSPDGSRIAFPSQIDNNIDIFIVNIDGSNLLNLTNMPGSTEIEPTWLPNLSKIAFLRSQNGIHNIWTINTDGTDPHQLTTNVDPTHFSDDPAYSPDGNHILYTHGDGGAGEDVWKMNADGSNPIDLTNLPNESNSKPGWSPDGAKIVFQSNHMNTQGDIFTMDANGANMTNISNAPNSAESDPAWQSVGAPTATPTPPCIPGGWGLVSSENTLSSTSNLIGVTAISPIEGWAVGSTQGSVGQFTLTEHWDGTLWHVVPSIGTPGNYLEAVAEVSPIMSGQSANPRPR